MNEALAEENGVVITGYLNVFSMPTFTFFDTGATYSFVFREFSKKLKLYLTISEFEVTITLPIGETIRCNAYFCDCPIIISGVEFFADFVVLYLGEFDIVLGMDWPKRYKAGFNCAQQKVTVRNKTKHRVSCTEIKLESSIQIISAVKAAKHLERGREGYLC